MEIMTKTLAIPVWFLLALVAIDIVLGAIMLIAAELLQNKLANRRERRAIKALEEQVKLLGSRIETDTRQLKGEQITAKPADSGFDEDLERAYTRPTTVEVNSPTTITEEKPKTARHDKPRRWKERGEFVDIGRDK